MLDTSKQSMRFWMAICSLLGLVLLNVVCVVAELITGGTGNQITMLFAGGLISVTAASVQWLFRNGAEAPGKEPAA